MIEFHESEDLHIYFSFSDVGNLLFLSLKSSRALILFSYKYVHNTDFISNNYLNPLT